MTPLEAFQDTLDRAKYFLRLRNGIINVRKRQIRSDWKARFCTLMHWNQGDDISRVDSADAVVILRDHASLTTEDFSATATDDLLRSALVYGVSAIDRYMHERVVRNIVPALKATPLNREQREFSIPASQVMAMAKRAAKASHAGESIRPANDVRNAVQDLLHKRPIQSWREIDWAFKLFGETKFETKLRTALHVAKIDSTKATIAGITFRRNSIVHEGDLYRFQRAGKAQLKVKEISPSYVADSLDFIEKFVLAIDTI